MENSGSSRHKNALGVLNSEMLKVIKTLSDRTGDELFGQLMYLSPTILSHIRQVLNQNGQIITDTSLLLMSLDKSVPNRFNCEPVCYIDDPAVESVTTAKSIMRAEVAVDHAFSVRGPKLFIIGSAPSAIKRLIYRRRMEPMNDICVIAAPGDFAGVVQVKESLIESGICSAVLRGKKGGIQLTALIADTLLNSATE